VIATIVSEVKEPAVVPIDFEVSGKTGAIKIGEGIENRFEPLLNPVTGAEESVQIHIPGGLEYSEGEGAAEVLRSQTMRSSDEISFDHSGRHTSLVEHQTFGSHR
jgi:hypothetical protein